MAGIGKLIKEIMTPEQFKQTRKDLNLTQRQLASELGLSKNGRVYIVKVENGKSEPSGLLLKALMLLKENRDLIKNIKKVVDF